MQEKGFNSKETHEQLKLLWENSADRGRVQYSSYRSFADTLNSLNEDGYNDDDIGRASALQLALNLVSFKEVECKDIKFKDRYLRLVWIGFSITINKSLEKWERGKAGGIAKASKSKAKSTKPNKTTKTKKKAVKSNPPSPDVVIQPEEIDDVTNFDIKDNHDGSYVDEPEVTEDIAVLAKPEDKDLSKSEVVSLICLNLEITSEYAIQIYNYRVLKKVSNSEKSIEKFCNEIDANAKKYKKTKSLFVENYVAGTWLEFIKTLDGTNDDLVVANTGVLVPNANGSLESSVSVDNNIVQFISESLRINQDLAVELHKFWTRKGKFVDETFVLGNGIDIHNAARAAERPTQEVVRFILKKDYNTFEVSWFLKAVVEENEAFNEMRDSNENKPNESLQLYLSNVADLKIIKSQIERKKENREKLTKEEDDFLNDFYDILAKERKEYDDRANLGSASGDESNLFLDEKKEK